MVIILWSAVDSQHGRKYRVRRDWSATAGTSRQGKTLGCKEQRKLLRRDRVNTGKFRVCIYAARRTRARDGEKWTTGRQLTGSDPRGLLNATAAVATTSAGGVLKNGPGRRRARPVTAIRRVYDPPRAPPPYPNGNLSRTRPRRERFARAMFWRNSRPPTRSPSPCPPSTLSWTMTIRGFNNIHTSLHRRRHT